MASVIFEGRVAVPLGCRYRLEGRGNALAGQDFDLIEEVCCVSMTGHPPVGERPLR